MLSEEMVDSFRNHDDWSKRPAQEVTCLYFSVEEVFIEGEELKEVNSIKTMHILKT